MDPWLVPTICTSGRRSAQREAEADATVPGDALILEEGQRREHDHGDDAEEQPLLDLALPFLLGPLPRRGSGTGPARTSSCLRGYFPYRGVSVTPLLMDGRWR